MIQCTPCRVQNVPLYPSLGIPGFEHVSEFQYLGYILDESGTDRAECTRKVASGRCHRSKDLLVH